MLYNIQYLFSTTENLLIIEIIFLIYLKICVRFKAKYIWKEFESSNLYSHK